MDEKMKKFCENHINDIENQMTELFTIERPDDYEVGSSKTGKIDIIETLKEFTELERIYSAIETGAPKGQLYEKYNNYLLRVREGKKILEREKEKIETNNTEEITNANVLLDSFKKYMETEGMQNK